MGVMMRQPCARVRRLPVCTAAVCRQSVAVRARAAGVSSCESEPPECATERFRRQCVVMRISAASVPQCAVVCIRAASQWLSESVPPASTVHRYETTFFDSRRDACGGKFATLFPSRQFKPPVSSNPPGELPCKLNSATRSIADVQDRFR